ncbi:uncharacterized protein LOC117113859 [Anneissia japonica]|uniref:uncharacterized protein LOC117113859 n=1 Tax=Anneissia japonica TaxID=1529436 RepID=UPI0014259C53|nr:uncharacterized protein LOC117113859 [Anneissia japonica]
MSGVAPKKMKTLNLKTLHSDDIGQLKETRASELGTIVRCYNHACAVSVKRDVAQWYNEQNMAVTKLSRGQQKVYKSLLKFHQIKKDIKRKAYIKKQVELQEQLREQAALEKKETELRELAEKKKNADKKKKELAHREMRKEKSIMRSKYQVLPGIGEEIEFENPNAASGTGSHNPLLTEKSNTQVTFDDQKEAVIPSTRESLLTTELSDLSGRVSNPTYYIKQPYRYNQNNQHRFVAPPQDTSREHSFTVPETSLQNKKHEDNTENRLVESLDKTAVKEGSFVGVIGKTEKLAIQEQLTSDISAIEAVDQANNFDSFFRNNSFARMEMTLPHFSRKRDISLHKEEPDLLHSGFGSRTSKFSEESSNKTPLKNASSPIQVVNLNPHKVLPNITSAAVLNKTEKSDNSHVAKASNTKNIKAKNKLRLKKQAQLLDDMNKYHVGILNRSFKLPNYKVPQIDHVTKYTKNSKGSLVPSEQTVKPASEEFRLPSNRKAYQLRKALTTERANEVYRERRLQEFFDKMADMERGNQPTPTQSKRVNSRMEPFRHHKSEDFTNSISTRNSVYAYILGTAQGDVTDVKNCRYLRTKEEQMYSRTGKVSSWE